MSKNEGRAEPWFPPALRRFFRVRAMISTRDLAALPDIDGLRRLLQAMALLEAIFARDWQFRRYSFNSRWAKGEQMSSMRNGMGDEFYAFFNNHGCFLKGFAHEAPMSPYGREPPELWPGMFGWLPAEFAPCLREPAFMLADTTFCIWRRYGEVAWQHGPIEFPDGPDPDGSERFLSPLDGNPETYREEAMWWHNKAFLTTAMIEPIFQHQRLTDELIAALTQDIELDDEENPHMGIADFAEDIEEIGYPS